MVTRLRDRIAVRTCNWILNHVASENYRKMITGALRIGLISAAANDLDGQEMFDLIESLSQMARGEMADGPD